MNYQLRRYKELLNEHDRLISGPGWETQRQLLVDKMDYLWGRMSAVDQQKALDHANVLYQRRIGGVKS